MISNYGLENRGDEKEEETKTKVVRKRMKLK
jgi:hypothetical protein